MALRVQRAARLRRLARGRSGFVALALCLYAAAAVSATWPAVQDLGHAFLAGGAPGHGEAAAGDHLQTGWHLWLVGDQLAHLRAPWHDPYTFRPETGGETNFAGWPFGLPYWPLAALFGPVLAWNLFTLGCYVAAGGLTCWWLRELGLGRGAALAGGLAFAIAPYRVEQSAGHLLGPISILLPLALLGIEKARPGWLAVSVIALASIPLSGQVHLALGAIPFVCAYALVRGRRLTAAVGAVAAVGAGLLVRAASIKGSVNAGGRSLDEVRAYQAEWSDFWTSHDQHGSESFVYLGRVTPVLALVGVALLWRARHRALALVLALGALVPAALALGTNLPLYAFLWRHVSVFRFPRVPERLLPIAVLCLAALVAFAVSRSRRAVVVPVLVVGLLFVDLHVEPYGRSAADPGNTAYAALAAQPPGRLLELPVFLPDVHYGSVYLYYDQQVRRQRPGGYSTTAPEVADLTARQLERLNCGDWSGISLQSLGVRYVALHRGLYLRNTAVPDRWWFARHGLALHGFRPLATDGAVTVFAPGRGGEGVVPSEPTRTAHLCQGWFGPKHGRVPMSETHAPFWVYGSGRLALRVQAPAPLRTRFGVDERPVLTRTVSVAQKVVLPLGPRLGWHLVTLDVPRLLHVGARATGVELLGLAVRR
jgi:hypothetical protein